VAGNAVSEARSVSAFCAHYAENPVFPGVYCGSLLANNKDEHGEALGVTSYPFKSFDAKKTSAQGISTRWGAQVQILYRPPLDTR
jgi:hypothetical protein